MQTTDPVKIADRRFDDMKSARLDRESEWQQISDHFVPRKDFSIQPRPTELRRRRVTTSVPAVALRNSTAMLVSNIIDPTQPFILPNAENDLVAAGRSTRLGGAATDFLDNMGWGIHQRMMRPKSGFWSSASRLALELWAYGTGVQWIGHKRGFGPMYLSRPLRSCWIGCNGDGIVDSLYFQFTWPLHEVMKRFANARYVDKWRDAMSDETKARQPITVLHIVEPRLGGERGGPKERKPFAEKYICLDAKAVLEENGYDSFPYAVPRLEVEEGSDYGTGRCWYALPAAMALSALQQAVEIGAGRKIAPPAFMPKRLFGKPLDQRDGAINLYDSGMLGFQSAKEAIFTMDLSGDVGVGVAYLDRLGAEVEQAMLTDWMKLRDSGNVTAEEIRERRALRVGIMSAHVPGIDREWMGVVAERTAEIMLAEGDLPDPPRELSGASVEWDYAGPLARAQRQQQLEGFDRMFERVRAIGEMEPTAAYVINMAEGLRACAEAEGLPVGLLRPRQEVEELVAADREAAANAEALQNAQTGAQAFRDVTQGLSSVGMGENGAINREVAA